MVAQKTENLISNEVSYVVLFRLIDSIRHEQLEQLFEVLNKDRIKSSLERIAQDLHENVYKFKHPFNYYHTHIKSKLYANLGFIICQQLMEILRTDNQKLINEYREIFALAWYILVFTQCDVHESEILKLDRLKNNRISRDSLLTGD